MIRILQKPTRIGDPRLVRARLFVRPEALGNAPFVRRCARRVVLWSCDYHMYIVCTQDVLNKLVALLKLEGLLKQNTNSCFRRIFQPSQEARILLPPSQLSALCGNLRASARRSFKIALD